MGAGKKTLGKAAAGVGARTVGKGLMGVAGGPVGWLMLAWTVFDIFGLLKQWFNKEVEDDSNEAPIDPSGPWAYQTVSSSMVNHFYNNPAPQQAITAELDSYVSRYLSGAIK